MLSWAYVRIFATLKKRLQWESKLCSTELHSDANSFVKVCRSGTAHILNRRRASDVEDVRQSLVKRELSCILHCNGISNPCDSGTKNFAKCVHGQESLSKIMSEGLYRPDLSVIKPNLTEEIKFIQMHIKG